MQFWWSVLLIIHGILAVLLLGAITHQAIGTTWPVANIPALPRDVPSPGPLRSITTTS